MQFSLLLQAFIVALPYTLVVGVPVDDGSKRPLPEDAEPAEPPAKRPALDGLTIYEAGQTKTLFGKPGETLQIKGMKGSITIVAAASGDVDPTQADKAMIEIQPPRVSASYQKAIQTGQVAVQNFMSEVVKAAQVAEWGGILVYVNTPSQSSKEQANANKRMAYQRFTSGITEAIFRATGEKSTRVPPAMFLTGLEEGIARFATHTSWFKRKAEGSTGEMTVKKRKAHKPLVIADKVDMVAADPIEIGGEGAEKIEPVAAAGKGITSAGGSSSDKRAAAESG